MGLISITDIRREMIKINQ
jgi:hypothetical protein